MLHVALGKVVDENNDDYDFEGVDGDLGDHVIVETESVEMEGGLQETTQIVKKKELTEQEKDEIAQRKVKQLKRMRKPKEIKKEFIEKKAIVIDPFARYNITFPSFGKLKGLPMSLEFLKSSHAKKAYDVVVNRKMKRLQSTKAAVMAGAIDIVALNSGPDPYLLPLGFIPSPSIPELDKSFNGELVMILWELEMNEGSIGETVLGWYVGKVHSYADRPPHNFIIKYSKEVTNNRKLGTN